MKLMMIGTVLATVLALGACGAKPEAEEAEAPPTFTGQAAEVDAYFTSDKAMDDMLAQVCADMSKCQDIPNIFQILKRVDGKGYSAFIERTASSIAGGAAGSADIGFAYATAATNRAIIDLEDADVVVVTEDTIKSFDEMKAVYPEMCVNLVTGRAAAPPADVVKQLFSPARFKLNMAMIEKAAENRKRIASGDLRIDVNDEAKSTEMVQGFFAGLSPADQEKLGRLSGGAGSTDEFPAACDLMGGMMQYLLEQPGGPATIRGLGKMGDTPT